MNILMALLWFSSTPVFATDCKYQLKSDSTKIEWTAFKTTEKKPVKGSFSEVYLASTSKKESFQTALESTIVSLNLLSVQSGDSARDQNLIHSFFSKTKKDLSMVRGFLTDLKKEDDHHGKINLNLLLNGSLKKLAAVYEINSEDEFRLKTKLNVLDFGLAAALKTLAKACFELHKGKDGISKTWPEVELLVTAKLEKECS